MVESKYMSILEISGIGIIISSFTCEDMFEL